MHTLPKLESVLSILVFANNPFQIYRGLRNNNLVSELADQYTLDELVERYSQTVNSSLDTQDGICYAYALLVAITYFDYKSVVEAFSIMDLSKLDWGQDIVQYYLDMCPNTEISYPLIPVQYFDDICQVSQDENRFSDTDSEFVEIKL